MRAARAKTALVLGALLSAACSKGSGATPSPDASSATTATAPALSSVSPSTAAPPPASAFPPPAASASPVPVPAPVDGGACALLQGPLQQPFTGAGALALSSDGGVDVVFDDAGAARVTHVAMAASVAKARLERAPSPPAALASSSLACAVAGDAVFCADDSGAVHQTTRAGGLGATVAQALAGTAIDAVLVAGKPLVAYVVRKKTEEGLRSTVEGLYDDQPVALSPEGATSFTLAPTPAGALLLTLDARTALTSVRAAPITPRPLGTPGASLTVGDGAVVFVGGPPAGTDLATVVATSKGGARFGLLAMSKDFSTFGMASITLDDPPRADEPLTWTEYPNGMPRAPVAATRGAARITVARIRPSVEASAAPRLLELGRLDDHGVYASLGAVATRGDATSVAIAAVPDAGGGAGAGSEASGSFWLLYTDAEGSWLERRRCP